MRTPEHRPAHPRAGKNFDVDLNLRYLAPGAFTVLPPDGRAPDPPTAPHPYKVTPTSKRSKHQSFAIIGETPSSTTGSRSSSPSGRVSPFKGRGFNPVGSRHASPSVSPTPPEDTRIISTNTSPRHASKIPQYSRRGSATAFGEKVTHHESTPKTNLNSQLSQSLNSLEAKKTAKRPPPNPRKNVHSKAPAFQRLSPIAGSSPEPSQSLSSPSRIPKSRSTPPSRLTSPTRNTSHLTNKPLNTKGPSKGISRSNARSTSRDPSPSQIPSPVCLKKYKNVPAKVNSFNKPKPKVPPKPQLSSEDSDVPKTGNNKSILSRKNSMNKLRTPSRSNLLQKNANNNTNSDSSLSNDTSNKNINSINNKLTTKTNNKSSSNVNGVANNNVNPNIKNNQKTHTEKFENSTPKINKAINNSNSKGNLTNNKHEDVTTDTSSQHGQITTSSSDDEKVNISGSLPKLDENLPSTTAVVSSTTTTGTKPLNIEADVSRNYEKSKPVSPMVDGRVLSATSVSQALNKMNDTVLNTQTVIKEHGFAKLSPAANAIISVANECKQNVPSVDVKSSNDKKEGTAPAKVNNDSRKADEKATVPNSSTLGNNTMMQNNRLKEENKNAVIHENQPANNVMDVKNQNSNKNDKTSDNSNSVKPVNNHHANHVTHIGIGNAKALELEVQKNMSKLISPGGKVDDYKCINDRIKEARTVIASDVKPIKILVKEKPSDVEVQSGNIHPPGGVANGLNERPSLPQQENATNEPPKEEPPGNVCTRLISSCKNKLSCKSCKKNSTVKEEELNTQQKSEGTTGCFQCLKKKGKEQVRINIEEPPKEKIWNKLKCCGKNKVTDSSCFPIGKRKDSWAERRGSVLSTATSPISKCSKAACCALLTKVFCLHLCCKKKEAESVASRKASIVSSNKKKSLTPTTLPLPEDTTPKIDMSLVEHTSHMKGAIPVLPVCLAWFCLVMNCIAPGTGTIFSGLFCLCIGKPRFSQKDGPKQRIGAFIIDLIIGFSQFFTVLFCLVGWGWSIWWGVIMVKVAKKHRKLKHLEAIDDASNQPAGNHGTHHSRDPERGL